MIETKFKKTEIGEIPEDWEVKLLKDICTFEDSKRIPIKESERANMDGIYPYYGASGIIDYINKYIFDGDYILLGEDGANIVDRSSRLAFIVRGKCWINNHAHVIKPNSNIDLYYLSEYLESLSYESYNTGTAQPKLNREKCNNILIACPPPSEQQHIASALSDIDDLLSALNKKIEKKKNIKQGAMQQLLTGKKRLPGFTEPWEEKKLGRIGYTYNGITGKSKEDFGIGKSKYITFLNVLTNPSIDVSILENVNIMSIENQNRVQKGDLFFNTSSETAEEVGICSALIENLTETYLNSFCFGFRTYEENSIDPKYWAYWFRSKNGRELMSSQAQGSTRYNLSKEFFLKSILSIPTLSEQTAISTILSDMDKEIEALEAKRTKYKQVKQGMVQQLLTGKIRLIN